MTRTGLALVIAAALLPLLGGGTVRAQSFEETNTCTSTSDDPCLRTGDCSIQGAVWFQEVLVDRADIFDTQGWPGLCDMVHVALVQGNCHPAGQLDVIAFLSSTTHSRIPELVGPLDCAGPVAPVCNDGFDNDGDGLVDHPEDPECSDPEDLSERPQCRDRIDNDLDGAVDHSDDPGCRDQDGLLEEPACQDGLDNDGDGLLDFDGGVSIHGPCSGAPGGCPLEVSDPDGDGVPDPDTRCIGKPFRNAEKKTGCGLGFELALGLAGLLSWRRLRTR